MNTQNPPWTLGPWEAFKGPDSIWWHVRAGGNGREIADTTVWNKPGEPGESEANARLIAAAPELVAALEAANDLLKQEFGSMYDRFDRLLARVRGEEKQG